MRNHRLESRVRENRTHGSEGGEGESPFLPLSTFAEAGLAGYEITSWQAMYAPAATPRPILTKMNADVVKALAEPDLRQWMAANATVPGGGSAADLAAFQAAETLKWKNLISARNIRAE